MNTKNVVHNAARMSDIADGDNASVDDRVSNALEEFAASLEKGQPLSRESLLEKYAGVAEELAGCLDSLDFIRDVAPQIAEQRPIADDDVKQKTDQRRVTVGDYRIIREIGRGGMGVVYEAEQLSLGRSVALKVLPYAAMMDQKAITRFKNEARAAATLDHPHIVPVFAVGIERGIHYYAMSLINGLTVAELVSHLQRSITDAGSSSDRLSIDDFLGHHGDPSDNLSGSHLEQTIDSGQPTKISADEPTDHADETYRDVEAAISTHRSRFDQRFFRSVARLGAQAAEALDHAHQHGIVHRDIKPGNLMIDVGTKLWVTDFGLARIESDAGMTMTGDLVGTLRYMAPEQALAQRVVVDNRADIYSLGASLYELLALRPPFDAPSRETLLKQIAFEEPKPLRHFNRAVPEDLQTIVHKALSKNPDDRYATAEEMGYDLHAFVDDEPIKARPLSMAQRAARWGARRKGLVAAIAGVMIMAVIGLLISNAMVTHERNLAQDAERSERTERLEADRQRKLAETNAKRARETVDTYLTKVSEDELLNAPSMQPLRRELLELALNYYNEFIQQRPDDSDMQTELADAYHRVGRITREIGSLQQSIVAYQTALTIREKLLTRQPECLDCQQDVASSKRHLALAFLEVGQGEKALQFARDAIAMHEQLVGQKPDGLTYQDGLVSSYSSLARVYRARESPHEALFSLQKAIIILEKLVDQNPDKFEYQWGLAVSSNNAGSAHMLLGRTDQAANFFRKSITIHEKVAGENPRILKYQRELGTAYHNLASAHNRLGERSDALSLFQKAIRTRERLVDQNPEVQSYRSSLAVSYASLGTLHVGLGQDVDAFESFNKAIKINEKLVVQYPDVLSHGWHLAGLYGNVGAMHLRLGQTADAMELFEKAIAINERLVDQNPGLSQNELLKYRRRLAFSYTRLAQSHQLSSHAIVLYRKAIAILEGNMERNPVQGDRKFLAGSYFSLGSTYYESGEHEAAVAAWTKGVGLAENVGQREKTDPVLWGWFGQAHYRLGNWRQARETLEKGIELRGDEAPTGVGGPRWWYLTMTLHQLGEVEQARSYYDQLAAEFEKQPEEIQASFRDEAAKVLGIEEPFNESEETVSK